MRLTILILISLKTILFCSGQYYFDDFNKDDKRNFSKIERHIRKEATNFKSVEAITKSINLIANTELEKAYAAYFWVSYSITYDMISYNSDTFVPNLPDIVLQKRIAVCSGYSNLFKALCSEMHVVAEVINGYSKGYGYVKGKSFDLVNHSWNAVKIHDKWFLLDTTWASPNSNINNGNRQTDIDMFYFLVNPTLFVVNHLPADPSWQLLSPIVTIDIFEKDEHEILKESQFSLIINKKEKKYKAYENVAEREVALKKRISEFNPKNKTAKYQLGVAILYQALDTLESLHNLNYNNVLKELPKYKHRIYTLFSEAAFHFKGALLSNNIEIAKSAQTFLEETIYQKGVFNYEAAQIIYDTTTDLERSQAIEIQKVFNKMINEYLDIAEDYFNLVPTQSWYSDNSNSYIDIMIKTRSDLLIK